MDNAGSTNKNQYMMASIFEIVQQSVVKYFRVSFMVSGHTKFAPDRLFALTAKAFYSSDIFNEKNSSQWWKTMLMSPSIVVVLCVAGETLSPGNIQTYPESMICMISWH